MKNKERKFHYAWLILVVASIVLGVFVPIVNSLSNSWQIAVTQDLGFTRTDFSLIGTITQIIGVFLAPLVAYFLTKYNFKTVWTLGAFVFAASVFGYSLAQNKYHFYILAFFVGTAYITTAQIPMMMLINNWFEDKVGLATSIAVSGVSAGGAILSPIISRLIANYGWRTSYRVYGIIILAIGLIAGLFIIYLRPEDIGMKPYGFKEDEKLEGQDIKKVQKSYNSLNVALSTSAAITTTFFIFLVLGSVMNGLANGATLQFAPAFQEVVGVKTAGTVISLYLVLGVIGKLIIGKIADKYGIYYALILGSGSLALTFVAMLFVGQPWGPWLVAIIFGLGLAIGTVIPPLIASSIFDRKTYGEAYGFVQSGMQVGAALGPLLVSFIYDRTGAYTLGWIINIGFATLTGIFWILSHNSAKKYANTSEK
ncbi:MFS transporter [Helcococcus massiliensis]|uniref:MFS transporter n=1 Tax=Helcococcus massiliensis TaxID=2040290 RepID=UPI000CDF051A|nr:MFS transporter [Helcococcus massiliensis]